MLALLLPMPLLLRLPPPPLPAPHGLQLPGQRVRCWALHPLLLLLSPPVCCSLHQQLAGVLRYSAVSCPALLQGLRLHLVPGRELVLPRQRPHCWPTALLRPRQQLRQPMPGSLRRRQQRQLARRLVQQETRVRPLAAPVLKHRTQTAMPAQLQLQAVLPQPRPLHRLHRPQQLLWLPPQAVLWLPPQAVLWLPPQVLLLLVQARPIPLLLWNQTPLQHLRGPQPQQGLRPQLLLLLVAASLRLPAQRSPHCCLLVRLSPLTRLLQRVMAWTRRMTILQAGRVYHQGLGWALLALLLTQPPRFLLLVTQCCQQQHRCCCRRQQQQHRPLSWLPPQQVLAPPLRCQQGRSALNLLPARCCPPARRSCPARC